MKRVVVIVLALGMAFGLAKIASADKGYDAVLTIDANKHRFGNFATLEIGMSYYEGYWNDDQKVFMVLGGKYTGEVENGQIIGSGSERVLIKTIAKKEEPKSQPKKEQKPQPKKESKPKEPSKPKPQSKQESKPKQQQATPKQENKPEQPSQPKNNSNATKQQPKQNNTDAKETKNQVEKKEEKNDSAVAQKVDNDKKQNEEKPLTLEELKAKNAEVIKVGEQYFAKYKDGDNEKRQKITEEEAKELGYEETIELEPIEEKIDAISVDNNDKKQSSNTRRFIGLIMIIILGLAIGTYYYIKRRSA